MATDTLDRLTTMLRQTMSLADLLLEEIAEERRAQVVTSESSETGAPELLNASDTAELIGLTENTLQNWRILNKGPAYVKIGGKVRYHRQDVLNWVAQQRHFTSDTGDQAQEGMA